jgi:enoyl-CoA hydratase/carnithine racemase
MSVDLLLSDGERVAGSLATLIGIAAPPIGWLVFNNVARRNAVTREMWEAIPAVMEAFTADERIKLVILAGAGRQAFVSGADISEFKTQRETTQGNADFRRTSGRAGAAIVNSAKPTLAMIRGACIGGGLATALNCDLRIASEESRFGIPAAKLGIGYPFAGIQRLVSLVGPAQAKAIMFTARHYPAREAQAMGLLNEVVADEQLETRTEEVAAMIAANAPLSIAASKLAIDQAVLDPANRDLDLVTAAVQRAMDSEDFKEGGRAFMEKRPARFTGS